jgi:hyperosmotically inducible protein
MNIVIYKKKGHQQNYIMQLNPKKLILTVCLGAAFGLTGLTGCQSHGDRTAGRYIDDRMVARHVKSELANAPVYKFPDVKVITYDGIVQLSGFVDTVDQKNKASEIAQRTDGVRQVINSLVLKPQPSQARSPNVINNENRVTPTGSTTGRRFDATTAPPSNWNSNNLNNQNNLYNTNAPATQP